MVERKTLTENSGHHILKTLEAYPKMSQRKLAEIMGMGIGRVNGCVKALMKKGLLIGTEVKNNKNKITCTYLLTSKGLKQKTLLAKLFLERKIKDYERLEIEIRQLSTEIQKFPREKKSAQRFEAGRKSANS